MRSIGSGQRAGTVDADRADGRRPVDDHRDGDEADLADVGLGDPQEQGQRGAGGDPARRPDLPDLLRQRHRRELLPRHADRVLDRERVRAATERSLRTGEEYDVGANVILVNTKIVATDEEELTYMAGRLGAHSQRTGASAV